jgi:hypothetical protein
MKSNASNITTPGSKVKQRPSEKDQLKAAEEAKNYASMRNCKESELQNKQGPRPEEGGCQLI